MSPKTANALVTGSAAWLGLYGLVLRPNSGGADRYRYLGAVALVYVFMALLADVSPEVAGPFAILLALAVAVRYAQERRGPTAAQAGAAGTGAAATAGSALTALPHF